MSVHVERSTSGVPGPGVRSAGQRPVRRPAMRTPRPGICGAHHGMRRTLRARRQPWATWPPTNSEPRPTRSEPFGQPRPKATARRMAGWSASGSVRTYPTGSGPWSWTISGCATSCAGSHSTADTGGGAKSRRADGTIRVGSRGDRPGAGRARRRQGRGPGRAVPDRGHPRAGRLLRDHGRLPAGHGGSAVDRRSARSAVAPGAGRPRRRSATLSAEIRRSIEWVAIPEDLAAEITRSLAKLGERRRLRRPLQRHGRGPADGLLRGPAGHVPERRRAGGDPPARQPLLGLALHRAGGELPPAERRGPPHGPDGRGRAADGLPAGGGHPVHGRPRHGQPQGRLRRGQLRPRRGAGLRPRERGRLHGAGRRGRRARRSAPSSSPSSPRRRRNAGTGDRAGAAGGACPDGCAGRAAGGAGPADRGALRPSPGHRMVPGRRWLPDRPEPADHDAVPHPGGGRPARTTSTSRSVTAR